MLSLNTKRFLRSCLLFLFWNSAASLHAQVERQVANHWYFGNQYGLDFSSGAPQVDNSSSMFTFESCATISNKAGDLLFYTNGGGKVDSTVLGYIWNRNHEVMDGGELGALTGGGYSAALGALSFEKPGQTGQYYLFTIDEVETLNTEGNPFPMGKGLSYFEIDMTANAGLGKVTVSNEKLVTPAFEHMSATKHSNCEDYWLLTRTGYGFLDDDPEVRDSFYLFKITPDGIEAPIVTPIPEQVSCVDWEDGMLRFSPDGIRFFCGPFLFDFDKNSGEIGDYRNLQAAAGIRPGFPLAFSPNGRFLYYFMVQNIGDIPNAANNRFKVWQYDLWAPNLFLSADLIYDIESPAANITGTPQLAPDRKIYLPFHHGNLFDPTRIYVVENPNVKGVDAQFHGPILELSPPLNQPFMRFGHYPDNIFYYDSIETLAVDLPDQIIIDCEAIQPVLVDADEDYACMLWSTGDTSTSIEVMEEGLYWLEVAEGCEIGRDSFELIYENNLFDVELGTDTTICEDEFVLLTPDIEIFNANYFWQDSSTLPYFNAFDSGVYTLEVRLDECYDRDTIAIEVQAFPFVDIGNDTLVCEEDEIILNANGANNWTFEWQDGTMDTMYQVIEPGFYFVTVTNDCGEDTDEIFVNMIDCKACNVQFPNSFTPNNDGLSDDFGVVSDCEFLAFNLKVFNRWGSIVFETNTFSEKWNGKQKSGDSPSDTYLYLVEYETINPLGETEKGKAHGDLTLIR